MADIEILETVVETAAETAVETVAESAADLLAGVDLPAGIRSSVALFPSSVIDNQLYIPASAGLSSAVVSAARDCVAGFRGDYVCFSYSDSETIVICADDIIYTDTGSFIISGGFTAFDIVEVVNSRAVSRSFSASASGLDGVDPVQMSLSGIVDDVEILPDDYYLYSDIFTQSIMISNENHGIIYSSLEGFAHLHSDSAYYLHFVSFFLALFGVSCLMWSIFKRVK